MESYNRLIAYHIKPSVQRIAIMDYLMSHRTHPTVDEIYTALYPSIPTLSKTTVYNTLKLFAEHGAAQMLTIDERNTCFDADTSMHGHFLCKSCNKIYDYPLPILSHGIDGIESGGHQISEMHYYCKGICKHCLKAKKN